MSSPSEVRSASNEEAAPAALERALARWLETARSRRRSEACSSAVWLAWACRGGLARPMPLERARREGEEGGRGGERGGGVAHPFAVLAAHAVDERLQLGQEGRRAGRLRPAIGPAIGRDAIGRDAIGRPASRGVGLNRASRDRRGVVALDHHPEGGERSGCLERGSGVAGRQKLAEPEEGGAGEVGGEGAQHVPARHARQHVQ